MKKKIFILAILVIVLAATTAFANLPTTTGNISKVTVYRGQALVTRAVDVDLPQGASEIIVKGLPPKIVPESIYAQTTGEIKVLSVRYREMAVKEDIREEVKNLDRQIEEMKRQIYHTERKKGHLDNQWSMFIKLRDFIAEAKQIDLNHGLLQFEPVRGLAEFIQQKGTEYIEQTLAFEDQIADLKKELELLERKRKELTAGRSRAERQAIIYITNKGERKASIELSYLVNGASWQQQYNLRANPDKSTVLIEYNAVVNQTSGENWDGVALSLSTAEPTMVAAAPILEPILVGLSQPSPPEQQVEQHLMDVGKVRQYQKARRENISKGIAANVDLNRLALEQQAFSLRASGKQIQQFREQLADITRKEGVSVTYDLPGKLSMPSRSDQQLVTIASISVKADFTLIATPLLTDYIYLQAELLNDSDTVLLSGPASMFRNDEFVGKSQLPLVTIGEKFTAGFGIDSQVQVTRELEDKKTRIQGGNCIDTYNYHIALNNYKNTVVELQLLDRLPYTEDSSIKIELEKVEPELSKDSEYLRTARKKGILRWDLKLAPNTVNEDATVVKYSFTMEYDKNMQIQARSK